jgi:D-serine deaminase-like pyridoxal phosphate-dependent protein
MKRRTMILSGGALALVGIGALAFRPGEVGGMHDAYFKGLSAALKRAGLMRPTLAIDRDRLAANITAIRWSAAQAALPLRVVAKSLPSPRLLSAIMHMASTERLMVFSADMLLQLLPLHAKANYLMGKPLPVSEFIRVADKGGSGLPIR